MSTFWVTNQRMPVGGGKRGGRKSSRGDTPPKKESWTPLHLVRFPTPSRVVALFFPVQMSAVEQARSSFGGLPKFFGRVCSLVRFPPPYALQPPNIMAQAKSFPL